MTAMAIGTEWLIDAYGCRADALEHLPTVQAVCDDVVAALDLHVVGDPAWHQFPHPGGVTGMYLLSESHLTCHTYPEYRVATFNLYCCRPRPIWHWEDRLAELLGAGEVTVRRMPRGSRHNVLQVEGVHQGRGDG